MLACVSPQVRQASTDEIQRPFAEDIVFKSMTSVPDMASQLHSASTSGSLDLSMYLAGIRSELSDPRGLALVLSSAYYEIDVYQLTRNLLSMLQNVAMLSTRTDQLGDVVGQYMLPMIRDWPPRGSIRRESLASRYRELLGITTQALPQNAVFVEHVCNEACNTTRDGV